MRLLLDTHAFLWWITDSSRLSAAARAAISPASNAVFWSAASSWELAIKFSLGRLSLPAPPVEYLPRQLEINGVQSLPINDAHAWRAAALPRHHHDPFDRMRVAQAQAEGLQLVTSDGALASYDVAILW